MFTSRIEKLRRIEAALEGLTAARQHPTASAVAHNLQWLKNVVEGVDFGEGGELLMRAQQAILDGEALLPQLRANEARAEAAHFQSLVRACTVCGGTEILVGKRVQLDGPQLDCTLFVCRRCGDTRIVSDVRALESRKTSTGEPLFPLMHAGGPTPYR